jgi:hypothetical protein
MKIDVRGCRVVVRSAVGLAVHLRHPPGAVSQGPSARPSAGWIGCLTWTFVRTHPDDVFQM